MGGEQVGDRQDQEEIARTDLGTLDTNETSQTED